MAAKNVYLSALCLFVGSMLALARGRLGWKEGGTETVFYRQPV